jgi:amino acid transporter
MVVAAAAPLTVVGGPVPIAFVTGNGAGVPMMFVLTGIVLILFAVGYTAMSRYVPSAGAFYSYVYIGLGRKPGIGTGYAALLSYLTLYIGVFGLLGPAIASLLQHFGGPDVPWWLCSIVLLMLITMVGYFNIELSGKVLSVLLVSEVTIVLILDMAILFTAGHGKGLSTGLVHPDTVFSGAPGVAFLFAVLGFIGIEATAVFRDEAKDPVRTIPRATYVAVLFIAGFYALTSWLMVSGVGDDRIAQVAGEAPEELIFTLGGQYAGQVVVDVMRVLFVTSIIACLLSFHNVSSRYVFSLSNRGVFPRALGDVHPRHGSPRNAGLAVGGFTLVCIVAGVLLRLDAIGEFYTWLVGFASLGYVLLLIATTASVFAFFRSNRVVGRFTGQVAPVLAHVGLLIALVLIMTNLLSLVGGNAAVAVVVVAGLVIAFAMGPVIGSLKADAGWDLDEPEPAAVEAAALETAQQ